jgi:hypothetical protein
MGKLLEKNVKKIIFCILKINEEIIWVRIRIH